LKGASLALQPSTKEGFESRVSDAIFQGVPVIGSNRGGIPLQIVEGESGYVIDPYDTKQWADRISELMTGSERYKAMKARTAELAVTYNSAFTTVPNATRWLALSTTLLTNPSFQGNRRWVEELAA
jgi:glycosyltransferase involved in cell wall biosynthesis